MDSDSLFDSDDDLFSLVNVTSPDIDINAEFQNLNLDEFISLIDEVLINEKVEDATILFYQVFNATLKSSINSDSFHKEYLALSKIASCIKKLKNAKKFNSVKFADYFTKDFEEVPFEVLWWLQQNGIMYMNESWHFLQHINFSDRLVNILKKGEENEIFMPKRIVQDILANLIRGCHIPNVSVYNLDISTRWLNFCKKVINQLINHIFDDVLNEKDDGFVDLLPLVTKSRKYLSSVVLQLFFKNILITFLTHDVTEFSIYSSYTYQELWCSKRISPKLKLVYSEIFSGLCTMHSIVEIIEDHDSKVNWKYTLAAIAVCAQNSTAGITNANDIALKYFNSSLKGGKVQLFLKGLLFIRQASLENVNFPYKTWYAQTFGLRNNFKATRRITFFKFFIYALMRLIAYEPKPFLKVHIEQVMFVPVTCNSIMHDYKNMCRARLEELDRSLTLSMNDCQVIVLHMIEETVRDNKISNLLIDIITNPHSDICDSVISQILQENSICKTAREILLRDKYLSKDLMQSTKIHVGTNIFDDDDIIFVECNSL